MQVAKSLVFNFDGTNCIILLQFHSLAGEKLKMNAVLTDFICFVAQSN